MDKAKHAFGSSANIQSALAAGKIDQFDILCSVDSSTRFGKRFSR